MFTPRRLACVLSCLAAVAYAQDPGGVGADLEKAGATLARAADRAQDADTPDYSAFTQSYRVPFANKAKVDFDKLGSMNVRLTINGGKPMSFQVDTGSTGLVVGAVDFPDYDRNGPPGNIVYVSSGVELKGVRSKATIVFTDSDDGHGNKATAEVPVLVVTERIVHPGAVNANVAKTTQNPKVYMFGVGHARGKEAHPEYNPWLNLKEMAAGTMRRGYTITRGGFTLGLAKAGVGDGYVYEKLRERPVSEATQAFDPKLKDWRDSTGWITLGKSPPATQPTTQPLAVQPPLPAKFGMLLDTGLSNFMIELADVKSQDNIPDGTPITVHLLGGKLKYDFVVGDKANPMTPRKVTYMTYPMGPLINTGGRALAGYDYLYDADGGYFGLRPTR